ncbi:hypothetical protein A3A39_02070 [Candidatus Kaiserbacteria bacterium RIFCSPLOWO2_01_FULL_54_13]|uniref:Uncharacterized protein n=1 Tax=Candidatus Kaiserbacteria bacterium RIFCSPLOWO2_01_FULL_54_13 TaxID=1798512 RepID=A0A1F6F151_9BACT|nr:MAG: hypothetical protein A3A39_02070 [Candidatus Kaiserbacteria bacterium RIFCSPLOWO2_01_FULL_54_13]
MKEGGPEINRRTFFLGGAAVAGVSSLLAVSPELRKLFEAVSSAEKLRAEERIRVNEEYVKTAVTLARERLKTPDLRRALRGQGENPLGRILQVVGTPIEHVEGTSFDVAELHRRYPVQIAGPSNNFVFASAYDKFNRGGSYHTVGHSNGFYWGDAKHIMANAHTLLGIKEPPPGRSVDMGLLRLPPRLHARSEEQIIRDDGTLTNADIHGALVAVVGIDPGEPTSDKVGHKTFLGTAFRIEPGLVRVGEGVTQTWFDHFRNSFAVVLPPDEDDRSAWGMSGAVVFAHKDKWEFGGAYWSSWPTRFRRGGGRKIMTLGFFHGIDDLRAELRRPDLLRVDLS